MLSDKEIELLRKMTRDGYYFAPAHVPDFGVCESLVRRGYALARTQADQNAAVEFYASEAGAYAEMRISADRDDAGWYGGDE